MKRLDIALLVLRLLFGGTMLFAHGLPKLMAFSQLWNQGFADPVGLGPKISLLGAVFAEVVCAAFVMAGWFFRWSLAPLVFTMAIAFFVVHASDPFASKELALLYLSAFAALWVSGSGRFTLTPKKFR